MKLKQLGIRRYQLTLSLGTLGAFALIFLLTTGGITWFRTCPPAPTAPSNPRFTADDNPDTLTLLVYNLHLLPRLLFANSQSIRAERLVPLLRDYDALILSEGFDDTAARQILVESLRNSGYEEITEVVGSNRGLDQDTGLIIASRWPIIGDPKIKFFKGPCRGHSCFNDRGVLLVQIEKNGTSYYLITAQLQSGKAKPDRDIRNAQIEQIREFIQAQNKQHNIPQNTRVIFGGSLPIDPVIQKEEYQHLLAELQLELPSKIGLEKFTVNPEKNRLAQAGKEQLLDHAFYFTNYAQPRREPTQTQIRPLRTTPNQGGWKSVNWFYWQCPQHDLSDHYAVEGKFVY